MRKGLQQKSRSLCIGKGEELERKARFCSPRGCKMRPKKLASRVLS